MSSLEYFERVAPKYLADSQSGAWKWMRMRESRAVLSIFSDLPKDTSIIELGCGAGFYLQRLSSEGFSNLTGVDSCAQMLAQIQIPNCEKIHSLMEQLRMPKKFDVVLCAGALEFVNEPSEVFAVVASHLNPGGHFILLYPEKNLAGFFYKQFHAFHKVKIRNFNQTYFAKLSVDTSFELKSHKFLWPFAAIAHWQMSLL